MKVEGSYSENGHEGGPRQERTLPYQIILSAESNTDAVSLSQFLGLIDVVGWEWMIRATAQR